jgi:hypothetical protein
MLFMDRWSIIRSSLLGESSWIILRTISPLRTETDRDKDSRNQRRRSRLRDKRLKRWLKQLKARRS